MKKNSGFTIIEMIIYIGIVTLISTSLTGLYINIIKLKSSAVSIQEVNESVRLASAKISHEIRQAKSINGVGTSLNLSFTDTARNPTIFDLSNGRIRMTVGTSIAYITSNLVTINTFSLTNLSSGDSLTQHVRYTISGSSQDDVATITNSVEVRSK